MSNWRRRYNKYYWKWKRMVDKLHEYQGVVGRLHAVRDRCKARWQNWQETRPQSLSQAIRDIFYDNKREGEEPEVDYSHIYRRKTRGELVRISAAVMGIEFSYAAETAFVSPTLLKIGVDHTHMTLVWALSPLIGFFLTPVLGSMSDRCRLRWGRRRPFIVLFAIGVLIGLILVPNGERMGHAMGDFYPSIDMPFNSTDLSRNETLKAGVRDADYPHPWGIFFTILGTVLLDFDADACQSPARAYLLDITVTEDHAKGLSTFTVMAGLGGFFGYAMGGINWDGTALGEMLGGHVRAVFTLITFIFVFCVMYTVTSFREQPLNVVENDALHLSRMDESNSKLSHDLEGQPIHQQPGLSYGATERNGQVDQESELSATNKEFHQTGSNGYINHGFEDVKEVDDLEADKVMSPTLSQYLMSIVVMPPSLRILCLTNLFCWMAHVCYSLYFTDFVGEAVFGGDPKAPDGTESRDLYEEGVRFGCWGMSMYSLSCACYSSVIEKLIKRFRAKKVYVGGLLFYSIGMFLMAALKHKVGVIVFSWTAGVMYSTLFTMPYLLVAHYHDSNTFQLSDTGAAMAPKQLRGLGTDVAIVSSMVFLAQFLLSICMGSIVSAAGTTTTVVTVAGFLAFCGSIAATQVLYLDL